MDDSINFFFSLNEDVEEIERKQEEQQDETEEGGRETEKVIFDELNSQDYFKKPRLSDKRLFFQFHPIQSNSNNEPLPFDAKVFFFYLEDGQKLNRNWLTYNSSEQKLYCSICLAFSDGESIFCQGFNRFRHLTQTVHEHEKSKAHTDSVKTYISYNEETTIDCMLFEKQLLKRKKEVIELRQVASTIINVLKLIGKQGLAIRGQFESAYSFDDPSVNHGNFLEIILLLCNYDKNLEAHITRVMKISKSALETYKASSEKKTISRKR